LIQELKVRSAFVSNIAIPATLNLILVIRLDLAAPIIVFICLFCLVIVSEIRLLSSFLAI
jgi:hypothetical protein